MQHPCLHHGNHADVPHRLHATGKEDSKRAGFKARWKRAKLMDKDSASSC